LVRLGDWADETAFDWVGEAPGAKRNRFEAGHQKPLLASTSPHAGAVFLAAKARCCAARRDFIVDGGWRLTVMDTAG
jgi:hypothetical protein